MRVITGRGSEGFSWLRRSARDRTIGKAAVGSFMSSASFLYNARTANSSFINGSAGPSGLRVDFSTDLEVSRKSDSPVADH
jgi:hypothetical protein